MEKTITLSTTHDDALLRALVSFAEKNEAEKAKLAQETKMLEAQEAYYIAKAQLADIDLKEMSDPEVIKMRAQNHKLRARQANRELQRELSTQGRREPAAAPKSGNWREGTKPVQTPAAKPAPKAEAKPTGLTHHMAIPQTETKPAEEVRAA